MSQLPVYFFIQGGGFNDDSNPNYNGTGIVIASEMNVIVVTFNYRVGPYGFLTSKEVVENGDLNVGLLDQRKALEWVQEHISKVCIFGTVTRCVLTVRFSSVVTLIMSSWAETVQVPYQSLFILPHMAASLQIYSTELSLSHKVFL